MIFTIAKILNFKLVVLIILRDFNCTMRTKYIFMYIFILQKKT